MSSHIDIRRRSSTPSCTDASHLEATIEFNGVTERKRGRPRSIAVVVTFFAVVAAIALVAVGAGSSNSIARVMDTFTTAPLWERMILAYGYYRAYDRYGYSRTQNMYVYSSIDGAPTTASGVGMEYNFGPVVTEAVTAEAGFPTTPADGCTEPANAAELAGKIVFVKTGLCSHPLKAQNMIKAGAAAVVITHQYHPSRLVSGGYNIYDKDLVDDFVVPVLSLQQSDFDVHFANAGALEKTTIVRLSPVSLDLLPTAECLVDACACHPDPCSCSEVEGCGWSSTVNHCKTGKTTSCSECGLLPLCFDPCFVPEDTPCSCAGRVGPDGGACGWSSTDGVCAAGKETDCNECGDAPGCPAPPLGQADCSAGDAGPCACAAIAGCGWSFRENSCKWFADTSCRECRVGTCPLADTPAISIADAPERHAIPVLAAGTTSPWLRVYFYAHSFISELNVVVSDGGGVVDAAIYPGGRDHTSLHGSNALNGGTDYASLKLQIAADAPAGAASVTLRLTYRRGGLPEEVELPLTLEIETFACTHTAWSPCPALCGADAVTVRLPRCAATTDGRVVDWAYCEGVGATACAVETASCGLEACTCASGGGSACACASLPAELGCGWSSTSGTCTATAETSCSECPSQPACVDPVRPPKCDCADTSTAAVVEGVRTCFAAGYQQPHPGADCTAVTDETACVADARCAWTPLAIPGTCGCVDYAFKVNGQTICLNAYYIGDYWCAGEEEQAKCEASSSCKWTPTPGYTPAPTPSPSPAPTSASITCYSGSSNPGTLASDLEQVTCAGRCWRSPYPGNTRSHACVANCNDEGCCDTDLCNF